MQRIARLRPAIVPSVALATTLVLLALVIASFMLQPPYQAGADSAERMLGWVRAGLFTSGAVAFVIGLGLAFRVGPERRMETPAVRPVLDPPRPLPVAFTLVALGRSADDTRAIADAETAVEAITLLRSWSEEHPVEHIVIFNSDAEPVAYKRPAKVTRRRR